MVTSTHSLTHTNTLILWLPSLSQTQVPLFHTSSSEAVPVGVMATALRRETRICEIEGPGSEREMEAIG